MLGHLKEGAEERALTTGPGAAGIGTWVVLLFFLGASPGLSRAGCQVVEPDTLPAEAVGVVAPARDTLPVDTLRPITLPPLLVTVLRSPVLLGEAPLSVSVLGSEDLGRGGTAAFLGEALQGLPGLQVQSRYNLALGERLTVRGAGARTQFGVRGLHLVVDGIPATLPDGQSTLDHLDLASLGRVELLRGPASALYGNGAAGVLRFETRKPPPAAFQQEMGVTTGSHGFLQAHALSGGTLSSVGYVFSMGWMEYAGFRTDPNRVGARFGSAIRKNLNGSVKIPLSVGTLSATLNHLDLTSENPGSIGWESLRQGSVDAHPFNVVQGTGKDIRQSQAGVSWTGGAGPLNGTLAGYVIARGVENPIPPAVVEVDRVAKGIRGSVERIARWKGARLRFSVGAEVADQSDRRRNFDNQEGTRGARTLDQREDVRGSALSLQGVVTFSNRANILAALRMDRVRFRVRDRFLEAGDPDDSGTRVLEDLTPSIGAFIPISPAFGLRASVSSFFQTPTTSELANRPSGAGGFNPDLDPQKGTGLELGLQFQPGDLARMELTAFYTEVGDELIPFQVPQAPGRSYYRNAGRSRHKGLEWAGWITPREGWRFRWAYTLLDSRFLRFSTDGEDFGGNAVPGLPRHSMEGVASWTGSSRGTWGRPLIELGGLYRTSVPVDDGNTASAPPFALFHFRLASEGIKAGGITWEPFLRITNLMDRRYASSVTVNAFGGRYYEPGAPRAVYLGVETVVGSGSGRSPAR